MSNRLSDVIYSLGYAALARDAEGLTDTDLLERFVARRDEAAFAALVRRHGPMVLGVCLRLLRHTQDAEDAFQATFLVLVKKAASIARRELLGNWLYGVAYRTASKARVAAARRCRREQQLDDRTGAESMPRESVILAVLDEELNRLPEKYRAPLVLCDLEGRQRDEAAQRLGCPLGTLSSRLARGRQMLRQRLVRRGVTLTAAALTEFLAENATAAVPASLLVGTIRAGLLCMSGIGAVSVPVAALTEGVLKTMFLAKVKGATVGLLLISALLGGGQLVYHTRAEEQAQSSSLQAALDSSPAPPAEDKGELKSSVAKMARATLRQDAPKPEAEEPRIEKKEADAQLVCMCKQSQVIRLQRDEGDRVICATVSPDGIIVTNALATGAKLSDVATGRAIAKLTYKFTFTLAFSADGSITLTTGYATTVKLWDVPTGEDRLALRDPANG